MQTDSRFALISDQALADLRARIGRPIPRLPQPHVEEATKDAIRHYAQGIGDDNPLWLDEAYARGTRWGDLLAPPTFLYAADRIVSGYVGGLPGVHAMFAGTDWHWRQPIRRGTRFRVTAWLTDVVEKQGHFAGRAIQQIYHVEFRDQHEALLATADSWCFRTERDTARELGKYAALEPPRYSDAEIADIAARYAAERPRGVVPLCWEDVQESDLLPERLKGPYTATTAVAYDLGWGGLYLAAHRLAYDQFRRHPALGVPNEYNVPEPPERVHWDSDLARRVGVPAAYDYGPERVSWLGHLLTDWIGDDGFLCDLYAEVRRHNIVGDLSVCRGRVTRKRRNGGRQLVDCEVWIDNQRGERIAEGHATVALPSRG